MAAEAEYVESDYAIPLHIKYASHPRNLTAAATTPTPAGQGQPQQEQQQQQPAAAEDSTRTAVLPPPPPTLDLLDFIRQHLLRGRRAFHYRPWQLQQLAARAIDSFRQQATLLEIQGPVNVCGDIHGQYSDLVRIFAGCGPPHTVRYLFLGDYVDRGRHSLEVICLLLACKVQFPEHIFLLRGNHELNHINKMYGFLEEVTRRFYPNGEELWQLMNEVFAYMPLAATIGGQILCMHGGVSPRLRSLDDIRQIQRPIRTVMEAGLVQDLLWSDPNPDPRTPGFQPNAVRNCSFIFGTQALDTLLAQLDIQLVIRAHQAVRYGYEIYTGRKLVTVFSAPRYQAELMNWAAVAKVSADLEVSFFLLKPIARVERPNQDAEDTGEDRTC